MINRSVPYINKKNHSPSFLFSPLFPSFSFCSSLPHFSVFSPAQLFPHPPSQSMLQNIYPCQDVCMFGHCLDRVSMSLSTFRSPEHLFGKMGALTTTIQTIQQKFKSLTETESGIVGAKSRPSCRT